MPFISEKRINEIRTLTSIHARAVYDSKKADLDKKALSKDEEFLKAYHQGALDASMIALQSVTSNKLGLIWHLRVLRDKIYPY